MRAQHGKASGGSRRKLIPSGAPPILTRVSTYDDVAYVTDIDGAEIPVNAALSSGEHDSHRSDWHGTVIGGVASRRVLQRRGDVTLRVGERVAKCRVTGLDERDPRKARIRGIPTSRAPF
jgi:hypothetical protein